MKQVVFLKEGRYAGAPNEPQLQIAKQDLGHAHEVSDTLADNAVKAGKAKLHVVKTSPIKDKIAAESK